MRALSRITLAAALAALLAPAAAAAQSRGDGPAVRGAALVGLEQGDWDGLAVRLDGEVDLQRLSPEMVLTAIGAVGYSRLSEDFRGYDQSVDAFSIVPVARLRFDVTRDMGLYADGGLGIYLAQVTTEFDDGRELDDTDMGFMARLAVGGFLWAGGNVRFQLELGASPHFGDYSDTPFHILVGAALPIF